MAADHADASRAGAAVLAQGGNAVDAVVAAALALGVVSPASSGIGGGGFLVFYRAKDQKAYALDFRETAPKAASRDMYIVDGKVTERSRTGGLAVAVPGEPAGLVEAVKRFGKLGIAKDVEPAVALAERGFSASRWFSESARLMSTMLSPTAPLRQLVAPGGKPVEEGQLIKRPQLGQTLRAIGQKGANGFYRGPVAEAILATVRADGGVLSAEDLTGYQPVWKEPVVGQFRGHKVYAAPPPGGGVTAIEALQILDARPSLAVYGAGSSASLHAIAEAFKHAFADRARVLGDPAFVAVPTQKLVDPAYASSLASRFSATSVQKVESYGDKELAGPPAEAPHDKGTSHVCAIDQDGNVATLTSTVNLVFGGKVYVDKAGIVLNNEMDDFSAQPAAPNAFGLIGGYANAIAPGKRPTSSMTPLIVTKDGKAVMCAGASGGPFIVTSTVQTVINVIDHGLNVSAAVAAPRIHTQWMPNELGVDADIARDVTEALQKRGHKIKQLAERAYGVVQAIVVKGDVLEGASDPRKGGAPAAPESAPR